VTQPPQHGEVQVEEEGVEEEEGGGEKEEEAAADLRSLCVCVCVCVCLCVCVCVCVWCVSSEEWPVFLDFSHVKTS
jgi:hypothetical protein